MTLCSPIIITPRLLPGVQIGKAFVAIQYSRRPGREGRTRYQWFIDLPDGREFAGDDLQSGCCGGSLQNGLESLLSFLGAAAESYRYDMRKNIHDSNRDGDSNSDLFPAPVVEWAYQNSDELSMLQCELEENKGLIDE